VERPDRIAVAEEVRLPRLTNLCEGIIVASPSGHVLFRRNAGLATTAWEGLIAPGSGELASLLLKLVRTQWSRRPEADAIFLRVGPQILLARAQAQQAEQQQVVITLLDVTRVGRPDNPIRTEDELATERRRLARELHDVVGQRLATLIVNLDCDLRESRASIDQTRAYRDELRGILASVRNVHHDLRWVPGDAEGLIEAVRRQVVPTLKRGHCRVRLVTREWPSAFPAENSLHVLRMVQESTANVIRHARASRTVIRLEGDADSALVSVTDNGVGFEPRMAPASFATTGLSGMRERASLIGGHLRVLSTPGFGTTVSLVVPLNG